MSVCCGIHTCMYIIYDMVEAFKLQELNNQFNLVRVSNGSNRVVIRVSIESLFSHALQCVYTRSLSDSCEMGMPYFM